MKGETRPIPVTILLTLVTCGIYGLFWNYWINRELRDYLDKRDLNPGVELLLCILCFPYLFYWFYKVSRLVQEAQEKAGVRPEDKSVLNIILAVFGLAIVSMAIIQSDLNEIWDRP
ncbi:MAG: DUF4234 domain-containing protein [Deltaproteobacteria bacterium]|nr:DUF4234 domain-containing protein [Deltaproteobacteria bacterium]